MPPAPTAETAIRAADLSLARSGERVVDGASFTVPQPPCPMSVLTNTWPSMYGNSSCRRKRAGMLSSNSWSAGVSDEPTTASSSWLRFWAAHWSIAVVASLAGKNSAGNTSTAAVP